MRVILLRPPRYVWPFNSETSAFWQPLGLLCLAAAARKRLPERGNRGLGRPGQPLGLADAGTQDQRAPDRRAGRGRGNRLAHEAIRPPDGQTMASRMPRRRRWDVLRLFRKDCPAPRRHRRDRPRRRRRNLHRTSAMPARPFPLAGDQGHLVSGRFRRAGDHQGPAADRRPGRTAPPGVRPDRHAAVRPGSRNHPALVSVEHCAAASTPATSASCGGTWGAAWTATVLAKKSSRAIEPRARGEASRKCNGSTTGTGGGPSAGWTRLSTPRPNGRASGPS